MNCWLFNNVVTTANVTAPNGPKFEECGCVII